MLLDELKSWMIVEFRDGLRCIVDTTHEIFVSNRMFYRFKDYFADLTCMDRNRDYIDIYKVYVIPNYEVIQDLVGDYRALYDSSWSERHMVCIWERPAEPVEMTITEIEEKLGIYNLKIIKEEKKDD